MGDRRPSTIRLVSINEKYQSEAKMDPGLPYHVKEALAVSRAPLDVLNHPHTTYSTGDEKEQAVIPSKHTFNHDMYRDRTMEAKLIQEEEKVPTQSADVRQNILKAFSPMFKWKPQASEKCDRKKASPGFYGPKPGSKRLLVEVSDLNFKATSGASGNVNPNAKSDFLKALGTGVIEPMSIEVFLLDLSYQKKVSESFYVHINTDQIQQKLSKTHGVPADKDNDPIAFCHKGIFTTSKTKDIVLVYRIYKMLTDSVDSSYKLYSKENLKAKDLKKHQASISETVPFLGHIKQHFVWGYVPVFDEEGKRSPDAPVLADFMKYPKSDEPLTGVKFAKMVSNVISDAKLKKKLSNVVKGYLRVVIKALDDNRQAAVDFQKQKIENKLFNGTRVVLDPFYGKLESRVAGKAYEKEKQAGISQGGLKIDGREGPLVPKRKWENVEVIRELLEFDTTDPETATQPDMSNSNCLFVYPRSVGDFKPRNIVMEVQLRRDDSDLADGAHVLPFIYSRGETVSRFVKSAFSSCSYHSSRPTWDDEYKIELPLALTPRMHLFFKFYNVKVNKKKWKKTGTALEVIGYAICPLYIYGRFVACNTQTVPVFSTLADHDYLHCRSQNPKYVDLKSTVLRVGFELRSTFYTSDPYLSRFFYLCNMENLLYKTNDAQEKDHEVVLGISYHGITHCGEVEVSGVGLLGAFERCWYTFKYEKKHHSKSLNLFSAKGKPFDAKGTKPTLSIKLINRQSEYQITNQGGCENLEEAFGDKDHGIILRVVSQGSPDTILNFVSEDERDGFCRAFDQLMLMGLTIEKQIKKVEECRTPVLTHHFVPVMRLLHNVICFPKPTAVILKQYKIPDAQIPQKLKELSSSLSHFQQVVGYALCDFASKVAKLKRGALMTNTTERHPLFNTWVTYGYSDRSLSADTPVLGWRQYARLFSTFLDHSKRIMNVVEIDGLACDHTGMKKILTQLARERNKKQMSLQEIYDVGSKIRVVLVQNEKGQQFGYKYTHWFLVTSNKDSAIELSIALSAFVGEEKSKGGIDKNKQILIKLASELPKNIRNQIQDHHHKGVKAKYDKHKIANISYWSWLFFEIIKKSLILDRYYNESDHFGTQIAQAANLIAKLAELISIQIVALANHAKLQIVTENLNTHFALFVSDLYLIFPKKIVDDIVSTHLICFNNDSVDNFSLEAANYKDCNVCGIKLHENQVRNVNPINFKLKYEFLAILFDHDYYLPLCRGTDLLEHPGVDPLNDKCRSYFLNHTTKWNLVYDTRNNRRIASYDYSGTRQFFPEMLIAEIRFVLACLDKRIEAINESVEDEPSPGKKPFSKSLSKLASRKKLGASVEVVETGSVAECLDSLVSASDMLLNHFCKHAYDCRYAHKEKESKYIAKMYLRLIRVVWEYCDVLTRGIPKSFLLNEKLQKKQTKILTHLAGCVLYLFQTIPAEVHEYLHQYQDHLEVSRYRDYVEKVKARKLTTAKLKLSPETKWFCNIIYFLSVCTKAFEYKKECMNSLYQRTFLPNEMKSGEIDNNLTHEHKHGVSNCLFEEEEAESFAKSFMHKRSKSINRRKGGRFNTHTWKNRKNKTQKKSVISEVQKTVYERSFSGEVALLVLDTFEQIILPFFEPPQQSESSSSRSHRSRKKYRVAESATISSFVKGSDDIQKSVLSFLEDFLTTTVCTSSINRYWKLVGRLMKSYEKVIFRHRNPITSPYICANWWYQLIRNGCFQDQQNREYAISFAYNLAKTCYRNVGSLTRLQKPLTEAFLQAFSYHINKEKTNSNYTPTRGCVAPLVKFLASLDAINEKNIDSNRESSNIAFCISFGSLLKRLDKGIETHLMIFSQSSRQLTVEHKVDLYLHLSRLYSDSIRFQIDTILKLADFQGSQNQDVEAGLCYEYSYSLLRQKASHFNFGVEQYDKIVKCPVQVYRTRQDNRADEAGKSRGGLGRLGFGLEKQDSDQVDQKEEEIQVKIEQLPMKLTWLEAMQSNLNKSNMPERVLTLNNSLYMDAVKENDYGQAFKLQQKSQILIEQIQDFNEGRKARVFGTYYRVAFYGKDFGEEFDGVHYVYKEQNYTRLMEIKNRLQKEWKTYCEGKNVEVLQKAHIDASSLDPQKLYIQITKVDPVTEKQTENQNRPFDEQLQESEYEQNTNLKTFIFSTPFVPGKKSAQGGTEEQHLRKTIIEVEKGFPFMSKRLQVNNIRNVELSPIEVQVEGVRNKAVQIYKTAKADPANVSQIQQALQGTLLPMIGGGIPELVQIFIVDQEKYGWKSEFVEQLKNAIHDVFRACEICLARHKEFTQANENNANYHLAFVEGGKKMEALLRHDGVIENWEEFNIV